MFAAVAALLLACAAPASAQDIDHDRDYILSRSIFVDKTTSISFEQARQASYHTVPEIYTGGYSESAHWLRLQIAPREDGGQIVLRILPSILDEVVLYEPDIIVPGAWRRSVTGDRTPFALRSYPAATLGFYVTPAAPSTTYYLRVKTSSAALLHVQALEPPEARTRDVRIAILRSVYLAFMLWLMFWAINDYMARPEKLTAAFVVYQAAFIVYSAALTGVVAQIFPGASPGVVDQFTSLMVCVAPLTGVLFRRHLFRAFDAPPRYLRLIDILIAGQIADLVLLAAGETRLALELNAIIVLIATPVFVVLSWAARRNVTPGLFALRAVFVLSALSLSLAMAPVLGLTRAWTWRLNSPTASSPAG
ncbi:MAG: hypothetical protein MO853_10075 [Candidatus Protistobacter heckmanni]|nr:hypothetical protein [Candidatus Protistobacter heckmanni]